MPCYGHRDSPEYVRKEALEAFTHNSPVAQLLCEAMNLIVGLEQHHYWGDHLLNALSPELRAWWADHKARDAAKKDQTK